MKRPKCPKCNRPMVKSGFTINEKKGTKKQRYKCNNCKYFPTLGDGRKGRINKKNANNNISDLIKKLDKMWEIKRVKDIKKAIKDYENKMYQNYQRHVKFNELHKPFELKKEKRWRKKQAEAYREWDIIEADSLSHSKEKTKTKKETNKLRFIQNKLNDQYHLKISPAFIYEVLRENTKLHYFYKEKKEKLLRDNKAHFLKRILKKAFV